MDFLTPPSTPEEGCEQFLAWVKKAMSSGIYGEIHLTVPVNRGVPSYVRLTTEIQGKPEKGKPG